MAFTGISDDSVEKVNWFGMLVIFLQFFSANIHIADIMFLYKHFPLFSRVLEHLALFRDSIDHNQADELMKFDR